MANRIEAISGELVDETTQYRLKDLCEICGVHADYVIEMVEAGIIQPDGERPTAWRFSSIAVMRSRKALRLQRDLDINMAGLAVTLDLLDQVDTLRGQLSSLKQRLDKLQR